MAATFPTASIIVVGYDSRPYLDACLDALLAQEYPGEFEVLFVDNRSSDGSLAWVRERFPAVRAVDGGGNLGYAGGNNAGARLARGEVLAFVNPDTRAERGWLRELVRPLLGDPTIGLTTSAIVLLDAPGTINTCGNEITLTGITTCRRAGEPLAAVTADEEVAAVSGAAFAVRASLFRELGEFDARFWMYLEDTDLSWRVRLAGYRCVVAARSIVAHDYRLRLSAGKTYQLERNRYLLLAKHLSARGLLALLPSLLVGELVTWGWAALRGPRHLWAKARAVGWALAGLPELLRARRAVQPLRRVPDARLLAPYAPLPAVARVTGGTGGRLAARFLGPAGQLAAALAFLMLGSSGPRAGRSSRLSRGARDG